MIFVTIKRILSGVGARQCEHVLYDARQPACLVLKNRERFAIFVRRTRRI